MSEQLSSLQGLEARLLDIQHYLESVASGNAPLNHQISYHLQDALNLLPNLDDPTIASSFTSNTNDQLLVVYLSSLLRAVIALHALVDNKEANGRAELEEGKGDKPADSKAGKVNDKDSSTTKKP